MFLKFLPAVALLALASCGTDAPANDTGIANVVIDSPQLDTTATTLPYYGESERRAVPGHDSITVHQQVPPFSLPDQDGKLISNKSLAGKVYITDFFFATCPGICPKMQSEVLKVYKEYANNPEVVFVSHTIDPDHDSLSVLRDYARRLGVPATGANWRFVRSTTRQAAYNLANAYFTAARTDIDAPGGIAHAGTLALVDDQGYVRGTYNSLDPREVRNLLRQLPILLAEVKTRQAK